MASTKRDAGVDFLNHLRKIHDIIKRFSEANTPIIVSLLPRIYTNIPDELATNGSYLLSYLYPALVRDYILYKRSLVGDEDLQRGLIPLPMYVDFAFLNVTCELLLHLDNYLQGALLELSPIIALAATLPPDELMRKMEEVTPIGANGSDIRKVITERANEREETAPSEEGSVGGEEAKPKRRRRRGGGAAQGTGDSEGAE